MAYKQKMNKLLITVIVLASMALPNQGYGQGIYVVEKHTNPIVSVATAVPAFIGYTPQAFFEGKSFLNTPTKVTSYAEFQAIFMLPNPASPADSVKQYSPQYYLAAERSQPKKGNYVQINGIFYSINPDPNTIYYMLNSIRLFYKNGGGEAYIVSVGSYDGPASGIPITSGDQIVNPNVNLRELSGGLAMLEKEREPTLYICPDATLLDVADNGKLMTEMIRRCRQLETCVSVFDIIGGRDPDSIMYMNDIKTFNNISSSFESYGLAYYPFVRTNIMQTPDIDYTNLFGGDLKQLQSMLSTADNPNATVDTIIRNINTPSGTPMTVSQYNKSLMAASKTYRTIINHILSDVNILPPSGGIAGVFTVSDSKYGVWHAPANTSIVSAISLPIELPSSQQEGLKHINTIRYFDGQGILIWGARTLSNKPDFEYISARRTYNFIKNSCELSAVNWVSNKNDPATWSNIKSIIGSFLASIWHQGGLHGTSAADAFNVECGFKTMTPKEIIGHFIIVDIQVALNAPGEFVPITLRIPIGG